MNNFFLCIKYFLLELIKIREQNTKFYLYSRTDGGFDINCVYAEDNLFNYLIYCIPKWYPNEVLLCRIVITVENYNELKRLERSKTK